MKKKYEDTKKEKQHEMCHWLRNTLLEIYDEAPNGIGNGPGIFLVREERRT